ncbi:MAG: D-alanyl-D-alanine carboxypeptidase [Lachnospiraceae bacterium]|nr:D-alanyl-D-alanine carboxypeptidase [Lachnospiraceae bacterium]
MISKGLNTLKNSIRRLIGVLSLSVLMSSVPVQAAPAQNIPLTDQSLNVESAQWVNWPEAPAISSDSAILMDAETGVILYSKNIHKQQYPASTTKILTTLIGIESCDMDEMVTFSYKATHDIDPGSNHVGIDADEQLSVEDCLKAILIRSANEVSFGIAEHIAGDTWENFAPIMNERAKELGALNSNFVNPNGLPNEEHLTTAYDLAMIGRAFFDNEILCKMTLTKQLHLYPTDTQPDEIWENNNMALIPGKAYEYEGLVGCKTGYTNAARSCLVSCAQRNGMKLICVVLRADAPAQYEDTIALFDYGFSNFQKLNVSQNEISYHIDTDNFFYNDKDIFGSSQALLSLNETDYVILPKTASFSDAASAISYETEAATEAAHITYTYNDIYIGSATIDFAMSNKADYQFDVTTSEELSSTPVTQPDEVEEASADEEPSFVFVDWKKIIIIACVIAGLLVILIFVLLILKNYQINIPSKGRSLRSNRRSNGRYKRQELSVDLRKKRKQQIAEAKRRQRRARRR